MADTATNIGENNPLDISKIEGPTIELQSITETINSSNEQLSDHQKILKQFAADKNKAIDDKNKAIADQEKKITPQIQNPKSQQLKQEKKNPQTLVVKRVKEAYEEISEDDKNSFLSKLSKVFEKNKNATFPKKNPRNQKEMPIPNRDLVKNYDSLKATLEEIKKPIRLNLMLRRSIAVNKIPFSPFVTFSTAKDENEREKEEGTKFKSRDKFAAVLDILTTDNVIKSKILDFTSLMKNENKQNDLFLFSIIMDPKYDDMLAKALNGNYYVPSQPDASNITSNGGKRKTKKNKINKLTSRKTRSIKKSKKNKTRRR
jgi:hypothetical protein